MEPCKTLSELLILRKDKGDIGITFIINDKEERFVSYKELYDTSLRFLRLLQEKGFKPGDEIVFQLDDNQMFIYSFWACLLGGMVPVPLSTGNNDEHKLKLLKICKILNNPSIITTSDFIEKLRTFADKKELVDVKRILDERTLCFENDENLPDIPGEIHRSKPEDIAFIQFSSGSTGDPKGVIITHGNVLVNLTAVIRWAKIDSDDAGLNWMPLTHDMGLIGTHIKAMLAGIQQYNIQTPLFIRHPSLWLKKASEHKVTILYSPNFGYKHYLKFFHEEANEELDLSRVRLIYNGAEPISLDLCNEFLDKMAPFGLKRNAMYPVYGLAEGTIAVTFPHPGEDIHSLCLDREYLSIGDAVREVPKEDKNAIVFLDVGYPIFDCYMRICDEKNNDLGENRIGFIQISGGNVTQGYYNNKAATESTISEGGWLNTGDLGFLSNGRLIITGRAKDIIFAAGQNYYSHDIERVAECVEGIELGKIAAAGVFSETLKADEVVVFVLYKGKEESFIPTVSSIKRVINEKMGIEVSKVLPIKSMPKTTSGKIQRYKLRESYIKGEFEAVDSKIAALLEEEHKNRKIDAPVTETEIKLAGIWSDVLGVSDIGTGDNFFDLGGDSLKITQIISRIKETFEVVLEHAYFFDMPVISRLAEFIDNAKLKNAQEASIVKREIKDLEAIPLSYSQQRLWFLDRLNGQSSQYNLYNVFRINGKLDGKALEASINKIVQRHRVLQSYFEEENGMPVQKLNRSADFKMTYTDMSETGMENCFDRALEAAKDEISKPFSLEKAPLIRGRLVKVDGNEHLLVLVVHHIVFDGWSFGVLLKELSHYYKGFVSGEIIELPELGIQYSDFVEWQRERQHADECKRQLDYWKSQLGGRMATLDLPLDKQRPAVQAYNGTKLSVALPCELETKLRTLARKENATLFMILLSAFQALLYRYTGQEELVVGSTIASRNRRELEGLIGFFTNNLVLRTIFSGQDSFKKLLAAVKGVTLEAYANQEVPFEKLVEELHVERDMSRNPLFQILFSVQDMSLPEKLLEDAEVSVVNIAAEYARFDLALDINETNKGLFADFEYNTDLFSPETISRMAGHYLKVLESIVQNPDEDLNVLDILTGIERETLLFTWNQTEAEFPTVPSWTCLFEAQADKNPGTVAVISNGKQLTYGELNERSNKAARYLRAKGVDAETIVGIYMERSVNMLVGLLAIHKAGGAYLPMDPIFPKERLAYMMEDSKLGLILTESGLADTLPSNNATALCIDELWSEIEKYEGSNLDYIQKSDNLAYLIYTSGSTGNPKGVQLEQYNLVNFLVDMKRKLEIQEKERLLAVTTLSFDIAGLELFMPLISGATVVLANREEVMDGSRLMEMLQEYGVTVMQATPATWRLLIEAGWKGTDGLQVLCGGEALPKDLATKLTQRCSRLWNMYGPTETTIWSTMDRIEKDNEIITIGTPIANTQVYVLDSKMNPVPVGIPGELYIGGDGVARGYLNQPDLTKDKFVPDSFKKQWTIDENQNSEEQIKGKLQTNNQQLQSIKYPRMYKTGDLVKYRPDGKLEFVGRTDFQVKIRGFRIELGEIETLLGKYPNVKQSVVEAKEISAGENALVAYINPESRQQGKELNTESLRSFLKEKLPDYMVPAVFMVLEAFPMTPNGKIDRKALPVPENHRQLLQTNYVAPENDMEKAIIKIWQELLKLDSIGVEDSFFDLGGHSLLLAHVRSRIKSELNIEVSMLDLFKYPTVQSLARFIGGGQPEPLKESKAKRTENTGAKSLDVAIIGLSGRFPGAENIEEFWNNLSNGVESISRFTDEQIIEDGVDPEVLKKPEYVKAWGALENVDKFDAAFFGYNPREAEVLDPQQRVFLEEAWKALENAGYDADKYEGMVGVYASVGMNTYINNLNSGAKSQGLASDYQIMISNDKDFLATRIAYKLNLEGPAVSVQTACSSSMVATHLACQSLINGECDMAMAGGVSIRLPQKSGYLYQEGMILSPDGHCKAFDEQAKGTVGGNGAGVVVLKRLEDAIKDGDTIHAVIKATAINNDGSFKIGYTAPSIEGQAKAIEEAQNKAGINPDSITYIEAHGTGTPLGDPIEIEALKQVFTKKTDKNGYCAVGSVKTNIGHLDAAAGVTGLIKTVLALKHKKIPPSLNYSKPNPKIDFENSPFFVNSKLSDWKNPEAPLRAGVSSFGIGGTNAHAILEEAPDVSESNVSGKENLLVFSAKTEQALDKMLSNFVEHLKKNVNVNIDDAAYTLQIGRKEMPCRCFTLCSSREDAIQALQTSGIENNRVHRNVADNDSSSKSAIENAEGLGLAELGQLWLKGAKVDWKKLCGGQKRKRISLPVYPFEGQSFWAKKSEVQKTAAVKEVAKKEDVSDWFYCPVWKQSIEDVYFDPKEIAGRNETVIVLKSGDSFSESFTGRLKELDSSAIVVDAGQEFKKLNENSYVINTENREHYDLLFKDIYSRDKKPLRLIHMMAVAGMNAAPAGGYETQAGMTQFFSLIFIAQALGSMGINLPVSIKVMTGNCHRMGNEKKVQPDKALQFGACRVIPREYPNIGCTSIDVDMHQISLEEEQELVMQLIAEAFFDSKESTIAYRGMERWIQSYENVKLEAKSKPALKLKTKGTYLITGGIGGLGLNIAEHLAREAQARLVLVNRSEFPDVESWDEWVKSHGRMDRTTKRIKILRKLQELGAEIMVYKADITDLQQVRELRNIIDRKFGKLNGLIHAAGNPGGGMIQLKSREVAEKVISPKVQGTLVLDEVFREDKLDFNIYCSSLNAITGGFGQIDYSAANAFLDAYARAMDSRTGTRYVSIDWDRWPGVGMAVGIGDKQEDGEEVHPLIGKCIYSSDEKTVFHNEFDPAKDWVLSEHLVMGVPTIAGTTYLEMARAAYTEAVAAGAVQIADVLFMQPMAVEQGEKRDVFTALTKTNDGYSFSVISKIRGNALNNEEVWQQHARGSIKSFAAGEEKTQVLSDIKALCSEKTVFDINAGSTLSEEFISFGSRWRSLKSFALGKNEGLVEAELSQQFINELDTFRLYPALLDVATGAVRLANGGNYLPFSYGKLEIGSRLESKIFARIRFKDDYKQKSETISSDIDVMDENGRVLVEITNFSMRLISESAANTIKVRGGSDASNTEVAYVKNLFDRRQKDRLSFLDEGITAPEGQKALQYILGGCYKSQIIVSTKDIYEAMKQANYINQPDSKDKSEEGKMEVVRHPRPDLKNEYVPPKSEDEKKLANMWGALLGIDRVGIHDEFFELGGDSLLLVQMHSKLKEMFETEIAVVDLYKYNTVALLAKQFSKGTVEEPQQNFDVVKQRANMQMEMMKQRRQQMMNRRGVGLK